MKKESHLPIAREAYTELAEAYAERIDTKPHNAYYERPATLSLLPDLKGLRVLDAGCGPGVYAEWMLDHGAAKIEALDVTEKMIEMARQRLGSRVEFHIADLAQPVPFLRDESFDLVVSPLVLDYVKDWHVPFEEFFRILKPGGGLVFSMEHPGSSFRRQYRESYFEIEKQEIEWRGFGTPVKMPSYRRSWQDVLNPLIEAGFMLDRVLEPQPTEQFQEADPKDFHQLVRNPGFLCMRAKKPL